MSMTKNSIANDCWKTYQACRESGEGTRNLIEILGNAIYLGARLEKKALRESAAENVFPLSIMQALFLKKHGSIKVTQRLVFNETSEESVRSMSGAMVTGWRFAETVEEDSGEVGRKVILVKNDGDSEFLISAKDPSPHVVDNAIFWIAEPHVAKDNTPNGAVASNLSPAERERYTSLNQLLPASRFPRYLQRRRLRVDKVTIGTDWRNAWLEYHMSEIEPYDEGQAGEELAKLRTELGLGAEDASEQEDIEEAVTQEPEGAQDATDQSSGFVDTTKMDLEAPEE